MSASSSSSSDAGSGGQLALPLETCQTNAVAPTPVATAVRVVCDVAQHKGLQELHGRVSPSTVIVRLDGSVDLLPAPSGTDADAGRSKPGHLAPEQLTGSNVDRRADVFAVGVIAWELLAGTRLFARDSPGEVRLAITDEPILDLRDVNPEVPEIIAEVVRTALERNRAARFGTPSAFCNALQNAMKSIGLTEATEADVAKWVAECNPEQTGHAAAAFAKAAMPTKIEGAKAAAPAAAAAPKAPVLGPASVPDFDVPGASRKHRSQSSMGAVQVPVKVPDAPPDLHIPPPSSRKMPAASVSAAPAAVAISKPPSTSISAAPAPVSMGGGRSVSFEADDDDDFDMEIERNLTGPSVSAMPAPRTSGQHSAVRTSGAPRADGTGLELGAPSRMAREGTGSERGTGRGASVIARLVGLVLSVVILGGALYALYRYVHRSGGIDFRIVAPHAFDGSSATESLAVALASIAVAVTLGFIGLRLKPHSWLMLASAGVVLLLGLAMVTVGLASSGENPTPPDGVLLVPYLLPAALVLLALGVAALAARTFSGGSTAGRLATIPLAAIAGAIAFAAFELSRFAH